jgi:molecular chaperone DnaK
MSYFLGIDLGTTVTAAATATGEKVRIAPLGPRASTMSSVVLVDDGADPADPLAGLVVGEAAERRAILTPERLVRALRRHVGDADPLVVEGTTYLIEDLLAAVLQHVVGQVTGDEGGAPAGIAVGHPAHWGDGRRDVLDRAIERADLGDVDVVTVGEPEAVAVHHAAGTAVAPGSVVAVYDLGGGTFDTALLRRTGDGREPRESGHGTGWEVIGRPEGLDLGGMDLDEAVFGHVAAAVGSALEDLDPDDPPTVAALARLRQECTQAKETLSLETETTIPVALPTVQTEVRLTRAELETLIRPSLEKTVTALRRAVRSAEVDAGQVTAVLLAGGSARIPLVADLVRSELGRAVALEPVPQHGVALGAARVLAPRGDRSRTQPPTAAGTPASGDAGGSAGAAHDDNRTSGASAAAAAVAGGAAAGIAAAASPGDTAATPAATGARPAARTTGDPATATTAAGRPGAAGSQATGQEPGHPGPSDRTTAADGARPGRRRGGRGRGRRGGGRKGRSGGEARGQETGATGATDRKAVVGGTGDEAGNDDVTMVEATLVAPASALPDVSPPEGATKRFAAVPPGPPTPVKPSTPAELPGSSATAAPSASSAAPAALADVPDRAGVATDEPGDATAAASLAELDAAGASPASQASAGAGAASSPDGDPPAEAAAAVPPATPAPPRPSRGSGASPAAARPEGPRPFGAPRPARRPRPGRRRRRPSAGDSPSQSTVGLVVGSAVAALLLLVVVAVALRTDGSGDRRSPDDAAETPAAVVPDADARNDGDSDSVGSGSDRDRERDRDLTDVSEPGTSSTRPASGATTTTLDPSAPTTSAEVGTDEDVDASTTTTEAITTTTEATTTTSQPTTTSSTAPTTTSPPPLAPR